jgi:hypothetical protein
MNLQEAKDDIELRIYQIAERDNMSLRNVINQFRKDKRPWYYYGEPIPRPLFLEWLREIEGREAKGEPNV